MRTRRNRTGWRRGCETRPGRRRARAETRVQRDCAPAGAGCSLSQSSKRTSPSCASGPGHQGALVHGAPKYGALGSADDRVRIAGRLEGAADGLVEPQRLGAADLDDALEGRMRGHLRHGGGDVGRRHRLEQHGRESHLVADHRPGTDRRDELEELRRAHDRVRDRAGLDQLLLGELCADVAALAHPVGADDRHRDVVRHARLRLSGEQVVRRHLEELHHRVVLERGRVGGVDDDVGAGQRVVEPRAGDRVDAGLERRRHRLVTVLAEPVDDLRSDPAAASDDYESHLKAFRSSPCSFRAIAS